MTLCDRYGVRTLVVGHGREIKYRGGGGSIWGDVDIAVEVVGHGGHEIMWRQGFRPYVMDMGCALSLLAMAGK